MYEFTLIDAFFASILVVIALLMAFSFGYTCKMERLTKALASETAWGMMMDDHSIAVEAALHSSQNKWAEDKLSMQKEFEYRIGEHSRVTKKLHREAMKKYKVRCNAKLARQVDLLDQPPVEHTMSIEQPALDVSYLLTK